MRWPLDNFIRSQGYTGHPPALDMQAPYGSVIKSPVKGTVLYVDYDSPLGGLFVTVKEDHPQHLEYYMGHMQLQYVKPGQKVNEGTALGEVGSTGFATGPHVHFQIRQAGGGALVDVDDVYRARNKKEPEEDGELILKTLHIRNRMRTYLEKDADHPATKAAVKKYAGQPESVLLHSIIRTLKKREEQG